MGLGLAHGEPDFADSEMKDQHWPSCCATKSCRNWAACQSRGGRFGGVIKAQRWIQSENKRHHRCRLRRWMGERVTGIGPRVRVVVGGLEG